MIPRAAWVSGCSLAALLLVLGLSRVRPSVLGPLVGGLGVMAAGLGVMWPQPAGQAAGACQPGVWLAALLLAGQAAVRWYHRRRVTHLPGFTRSRYEPGTNGTAGTAAGTGSAAVPAGSAATASAAGGG